GCKITGKGTIKTGKLDFENVYFGKDLKDFKLIDDTNVLLRTPRQHNMYSIDLNNIVPHKDLTCLVAKAFAYSCKLWHKRLGSRVSSKSVKVEKAMNGLHQVPRAWYGTLSKYLLTNGFQRGTIDQTLFIRRQRGDFILVQVYVDDIIFGSSNPQLCREFEALMHEKFQMSAMGELNIFLGLQVLQKEDGIFSLKTST
nr:putative ribonuclease H-like domain-containing protein [Tanacetum cinerariifolium]